MKCWLLQKIILKRNQLSDSSGKLKPIWLKIAPDLSESEIKKIIDIAIQAKIDALIVSNTTISRPSLKNAAQNEIGGLSGIPLSSISDHALKAATNHINGKIPVIGVGGVFKAEDVYRKLSLGASMVQIYTGFIYEGPGIVKQINKKLIQLMNQNHINHISEITR